MNTFTHRTTGSGNVSYQMTRRGASNAAPWSYCFWWRGVRYRKSTEETELTLARGKAEAAIDRAINTASQEAELLAAAPTGTPLADLREKFLDARFPIENREDTEFKDWYRCSKQVLRYWFESGLMKNLTTASTVAEVRISVQDYLSSCSSLKGTTIKNRQKIISTFLAWVMSRQLVAWPLNPAMKKQCGILPPLDLPRVKVAIKESASIDTVKAWLEAQKENSIYPVLVLMCSGLRRVGLSRVTWEMIHFGDEPVMRGWFEKGKERKVPLSKWAANALLEWRRKFPVASESQRVCPLQPQSITCSMARISKQCGSKLTLSAMRRLTVFNLWQAKVPVQMAALIMGHSVAVAERYYADFRQLYAHDEIEKLGAVYADPAPAQVTKVVSMKKDAARKANGVPVSEQA